MRATIKKYIYKLSFLLLFLTNFLPSSLPKSSQLRTQAALEVKIDALQEGTTIPLNKGMCVRGGEGDREERAGEREKEKKRKKIQKWKNKYFFFTIPTQLNILTSPCVSPPLYTLRTAKV